MFDIILPFCTVLCVKLWQESSKTWIKITGTIIAVLSYCVLMLESSYKIWREHKLFGVGLINGTRSFKKHIIKKLMKVLYIYNIYAHYFSTTSLVGRISFVFFLLTLLIILENNAGMAVVYYTYAMIGSLMIFLCMDFLT